MTWPDRPRLLLSYAYITEPTLNVPDTADVLIDSGAFTAHTTGKQVNLGEYCGFLAANADKVTAAFALDVIGDATASLTNYHRMRDRLDGRVTIIPTWHVGSSWEALDELLTLTDYVAVGGMVPHYRQRAALTRVCIKAHLKARAAGVRLHGLGATGNAVRRLPWHSVDSSSWTMPRRRPLVYVADRAGYVRSITRGNVKEATANAATLRRYGLDPAEFATYGSSVASTVGADIARARVAAAVTASLRSYMHAEATHPHDTRIYLAGQPGDVPTIRAAWLAGSPWAQA